MALLHPGFGELENVGVPALIAQELHVLIAKLLLFRFLPFVVAGDGLVEPGQRGGMVAAIGQVLRVLLLQARIARIISR